MTLEPTTTSGGATGDDAADGANAIDAADGATGGGAADGANAIDAADGANDVGGAPTSQLQACKHNNAFCYMFMNCVFYCRVILMPCFLSI